MRYIIPTVCLFCPNRYINPFLSYTYPENHKSPEYINFIEYPNKYLFSPTLYGSSNVIKGEEFQQEYY